LFKQNSNAKISLVYTWHTFTGVKSNNNKTQYSKIAIFGSINKQGIESELHQAQNFHIMSIL